ncbi:hypothetical protein [Methylobacterium nodulans]|uniref:Uncharacterized protein n=1 Tax=Methylobacterium nodulans (strain LMG 21967 / CNCM I-2342 / ORS 2060) TaxID=460265 RepID=B8IBW6_METNO|nr:hypothetical protein [Methylobacterium nodulans]ACL61148.1 conserved hypothetical protein [Methylobacterium nodulans ORS 2060]
MTRYRARPSFTVEIKRTRTSPIAASSETAAPKAQASALWAGTGLIEEAAAATQSGRFDPEPTAPQPSRSRAAAAPSRRVLPSLIVPPEPPPPEPEPVVEEEPIFRRQRRPAARKPAAPPARRGFVWPEDWPDEPPAAPAPAVAPPDPAPVALAAVRNVSEAAPRSKRREEELRVGERWKRRLPRYCR